MASVAGTSWTVSSFGAPRCCLRRNNASSSSGPDHAARGFSGLNGASLA